MSADVIIGCQWGDEGKGKIVDKRVSSYRANARCAGGHNAGHTVIVDGQKYVFHMAPSGLLHSGVYNAIGNGCVIDLKALGSELEGLQKAGVQITPENFGISYGAHVIMPYHVEEERSKLSKSIGTTGRGIGPAYTDKARRSGVRISDLYNIDKPEIRDRVLGIIESRYRIDKERFLLTMEKHYSAGKVKRWLAKALLTSLDKDFDVDPRKVLRELQDAFQPMKQYADDVSYVLNRMLAQGSRILIEGAQGAGLDVDHGTYPNVTSSNTTIGGVLTGLGIEPHQIGRVTGVVKAYATRVGSGAFPTELDNAIGEGIRERGIERGASTGRPRRCGWYDAVQVADAVKKNGVTELAVMKLDVLDEEPGIRLCDSYELDGREARFPASDALLALCKPLFENFDGWMTSTKEARNMKELPKEAKAYLKRLEMLAGVPITYVSVGPDRTQGIEADWL
ncbi:MAG TPA: adenylosuccinate synthase [Candidatus Aenigmarchaeota archaeon]|nr:adenylosuccinate synthase [Candidatus Aenigmarchaeota archaeon]